MQLITIVEIIIALMLITAILLQSKGGGLGETFGGASTFYHTRKGLEKVLFIATIVLAGLFFLTSILNFIF
jgi:preprotein translocase subunit SecG